MKSLCNKIFEEALKDMHTYHDMSSNIFPSSIPKMKKFSSSSSCTQSKFTEKCVYSPNTLVKYWLKVFILQFIICIASDFPPSFLEEKNLMSRIRMLHKKIETRCECQEMMLMWIICRKENKENWYFLHLDVSSSCQLIVISHFICWPLIASLQQHKMRKINKWELKEINLKWEVDCGQWE